MWAASGRSPASRSATYASTVVDRSPSPPRKFAQVPSARCTDLIHRAAAVGLLRGPDAEELAEQQVLGVHGDVGLQLALPPALAVLEAEQVAGRAVQRRRRRGGRAAVAGRRRPSLADGAAAVAGGHW